MADPRHQPLARPRFPLQQQRRHLRLPDPVEGREVLDLGAQRVNNGGLPYQPVSGRSRGNRALIGHGDLLGCSGGGDGAWPPGVAKMAKNGGHTIDHWPAGDKRHLLL